MPFLPFRVSVLRLSVTMCVLIVLSACERPEEQKEFPVQAESAYSNLLQIEPTPERGIQPRLLTDESGTIHLLYFRKRLQDPRNREGDLYYSRLDSLSANANWTVPLRVSTRSFAHLDAIGRAGLAVDGAGLVHVVWFQDRPHTSYFYTRLNADGTAFEEQREIVTTFAEGLDAGAEIAAYGSQIAIVWAAGDLQRESERTVYMRLSEDSGVSFGTEIRIGDPALGACACCSLAAEFSTPERLHVAYRSAIGNGGRHMQLLSLDPSASGAGLETAYRMTGPLQEWELYACPVSTNDFLRAQDALWLGFETSARSMLERFEPQSGNSEVYALGSPLTETRQKNATVAINDAGDILAVWGEAISYSRGGALNLTLLNGLRDQIPLEEPDVTIPDFSFPAAAPLPDGRFLILY